MFNSSDLAAILFLSHAREQKRLFTGQLYTPAEVAEISADRGNVLQAHWYLGGQVPSEMFDKARLEDHYRHSARLYTSPGGLLYGVIGQQLGSWEHRFLVQLMGEQFEAFIRETQHSRLRFTLADANGPLATVLSGPDDMHLSLPTGKAVPSIPTDLENVLVASADCMRMATLLLSPNELRAPTDWTAIEEVCLSVVQPKEFLAQMEALAATAEGKKPQ
jgi:hypothetical protein